MGLTERGAAVLCVPIHACVCVASLCAYVLLVCMVAKIFDLYFVNFAPKSTSMASAEAMEVKEVVIKI